MSEQQKKKILVIGDGATSSGFARVVKSIFIRLSDHYDIKQLLPFDVSLSGSEPDWPWPLFGIEQGEIDRLLDDLQPELILIVNDMHVIRKYMLLIDSWRKTHEVKLLAYCPIDLTPLPLDLVGPLQSLDVLVAYTEFGRHVIEASFLQLNAGNRVPEMRVIPHGIDTDVFFPLNSDLSDRKAARRTIFGEDVDYLDAFIVLNANRNQPRKRIDLTIRGFSLFAEGKPANVFLYLHMGMKDLAWDIEELCKRHGIYERLIVSANSATHPSVDDERLNVIYNACDVGVNTAVAEGWGLVSFEHAATGAAQIVPCHTALAELWEGSAVTVRPSFSLTDPKGLFDEYFVAPEDIASSLESLYRNPAYRQQMSLRAYLNAVQPKYSWGVIAETWKQLLDQCLN
jgi:glycosyltransferase involved in cell wall biosynthesis